MSLYTYDLSGPELVNKILASIVILIITLFLCSRYFVCYLCCLLSPNQTIKVKSINPHCDKNSK